MSVINGIIAPQSFEIIRDRIGEILKDEIDNQYTLSSNDDIANVDVWVERFVPFDKKELPAINIQLAPGTYDGHTVIQADGTYRYNIDVYESAKTNGANKTDQGDVRAILKLQKLMGMCMAILMDARYKTLGFNPPFIMHRHVDTLGIVQTDENDTRSTVQGRLVLLVKAPEVTALVQPVLADAFITQVKLELTEKGYRYETDNYT